MKPKRHSACEFWLAFAWLILLVPKPLLSQRASQSVDNQLRADAQSKIKALAGRFAEILAPQEREAQLQAACRINCSAIADAATGKTVGAQLEEIHSVEDAALSRLIAEIELTLDSYIVRTFRTTNPDLGRVAVAKALGLILQDETAQPPAAFILRSPKGSSLLVFYELNRGSRTTTVLRAYVADGKRLRISDSAGADMNDHLNLAVKELPSPKSDEIWLLVSGQQIGANGPNIRMRVFAYDGRKFKTMWMPADQWGHFKTRVTQYGFTVDGDYYRSGQPRHEEYQLAPEGLYLEGPA